MITYRVDKQALSQTNSQIRDMLDVLAAVAETYQTLQNSLVEHKSAISSPTIDNFRQELEDMLNESVELASRVTQHAQKLAAVSEQAAKHLVAIEEHFGAVLRDKATTAEAAVQS